MVHNFLNIPVSSVPKQKPGEKKLTSPCLLNLVFQSSLREFKHLEDDPPHRDKKLNLTLSCTNTLLEEHKMNAWNAEFERDTYKPGSNTIIINYYNHYIGDKLLQE